jgi:AAA15 family ATPase/GTPase
VQKLIFESYLCRTTFKKDSIKAKIKINMLIKSIEINNFRCFNKTEAKDFSNINLLGGKNNAGKTALLEALLLANEIENASVKFLLNFRNIGSAFVNRIPQKAFDNLFYDPKKKVEILISTDSKQLPKYITHLTIENHRSSSALLVQAFEGELENENVNSRLDPDDAIRDTEQAQDFMRYFKKTQFMIAGFLMTTEQLGLEFDKLKYEGHTDVLVEAFKRIDPSIERVDTFNIGKSAIYLQRKKEKYMQLSLFGDAMTKVATYILNIVRNPDSVILIDEIENGIHHTNQKHLWKMLFDLSQRFGVQIFATTHSAEMIEAFKDTIKENELQNQARYFELARHSVSNEIIVQKIPMNALEQKLITKKPMRGE